MEQDICFVDLRAVLAEQALETNVGDGLGLDDVSGRALDHGDIITLLEVVLRNIVCGVAGSDHNGFLALAIALRTRKFGRMAEAISSESLDACHGRHVILA